MKTKIVLLMTAISVAGALLAGNPLLETYKTPHQTIPFDKIKIEHYMPAFEEAMKQHDAEIKAIVENPKPATFENTIVALDRSGSLLTKVSSPFYNLLSSETNDEMQAIAQKVSPLFTEHSNAIRLKRKAISACESCLRHEGAAQTYA